MMPLGLGKDIPMAQFIYDEDILRFLRNLNEARHLTKGELHLALFRGSWGVNFYNESIYRYLSGQENVYPKSRYFCPMMDDQYYGVMMGSNKVYGCFQGVSFEEFEIGTYGQEGIQIDRHMPGAEWLHQNLRGMCSADDCPEHDICLGGCRVSAYSWARQAGDSDPISAGQDFCMTNFLRTIGRGEIMSRKEQLANFITTNQETIRKENDSMLAVIRKVATTLNVRGQLESIRDEVWESGNLSYWEGDRQFRYDLVFRWPQYYAAYEARSGEDGDWSHGKRGDGA